MTFDLSSAIFFAGLGQLSLLIAAAVVPVTLKWIETLANLPRLIRQLFWVYSGYTVLSIVGLGVICIVNSDELAAGSLLARSICAYAATFWSIRLFLQGVLSVRVYLTTWWLWAGEVILTVLFIGFTAVFVWGVVH